MVPDHKTRDSRMPRNKEKCQMCGKLVEYHGDVCDSGDIQRHKTNLKARERARVNRQGLKAAMDSIGAKRVRGNLGGTYWE